MKTIIYMATSLNGYIARLDDETDFVSEVEWEKGFFPAIEKAGSLVVGRKTYGMLRKDGNFDSMPADTIVIAVSKSELDVLDGHHLVSSPQEACSLVEKNGCKECFVAGGAQLNSAFLKEGLVDEIYIDVEAVLIAKGINFISGDLDDIALSLKNIKKLSDDLIQLHYKVKK